MFAILTFSLAVASMILHFVAPRTKSTLDDKLADGVDKATELLPAVKSMLPSDAAAPAGRPLVVDHR